MFRYFDLFGKPVVLNFNGQTKSKSFVGACFSLIFIGYIFWAIYEVGKDLILRQDPKTILSESYDEDPLPMVVSPDTFNFGFGLQDPVTYAHYMNESIYTVDAYMFAQRRMINENGTVEVSQDFIPLEIEKCTKDHFGILGYKFETLVLNGLYCLKKEQPNIREIIIQGAFESSYYADIGFEIKRCVPTLSKVECAPKEIIDEMLGGWFAVYFTNLAIQPKNHSNPVTGYRDSYYTSLVSGSFKELTLWLSHVEVASDVGWLLNEEKLDKYIKFDYEREHVSVRQDTTNVMELIVRVGKITSRYERSYIKLQDILAKTNGFITAGILAALVFISPYSNMKFNERLINELFEIKVREEKGKKNNKKKKKVSDESKKDQVIENKSLELLQQKEELKIRGSIQEEKIGNLYSPSERQSFVNSPETQDIDKGMKEPIVGVSAITSRRASLILKTVIHKSNSIVGMNDERSVEMHIESKGSNFCDEKYDQTQRSNNESIHYQNLNDDKVYCNQEKEEVNVLPTSNLDRLQANKLQSLENKPRMTPKLQIKVLEHYEPQIPGQSLGNFEHLLIQNREANSMSNDRHLHFKKSKKRMNTFSVHNKTQENLNQRIDEEELMEKRTDKLRSYFNKESKKIRISFGEYLCSFFWKSESLKEKLGLLNEGVRRIQERLDIFNVLKKFREVDKLKLLLLANEQFVLFDTLPNPELSLKNQKNGLRRFSFSHNQLKEIKFINEKRRSDLICVSYRNLKKKGRKTMIDEKILEIYDDIVDC